MSLGRSIWGAIHIGVLLSCTLGGSAQATQRAPSPTNERLPITYFVDCTSQSQNSEGSERLPINSLAQVNSLSLHAGDSVLFKRGSICKGSLEPRGSGENGNPIRLGAYAEGPLPRIQAQQSDESALRLYNQSFWEVSSLDLAGGTTYGIYASGDAANLKYLHLRDVRVHDVRGPLKHKESGLVVIRASTEQADYEDVELDGVEACDTTQWSGIFISGASHVRVRNSTVHDVQGDGIVVFHANDAVISRSLAWHTGMQHQFTIGTPNAIWTWQCTDCTVEDNEAFLTDSPGIDGGSFDIDFGNTRNSVRHNFGHDTAGYCVSIFGAFGPTVDSRVTDNLCLNNGTSPRLAQRQGALLLMTWQGGSLEGVAILGNRIYWDPPGETPALQAGDNLNAAGVVFSSNDLWSSGLVFVDPALPYSGDHNHYRLGGGDSAEEREARPMFLALHETGSTLTIEKSGSNRVGKFGLAATNTTGWRLELSVPAGPLGKDVEDDLRGILVQLKSAALQFSHCGLKVTIGGPSLAALAVDWSLQTDGVSFDKTIRSVQEPSLRLVSPDGKVLRQWHTYPSPVDLGLSLRQNIGPPDYSHLSLEEVRAKD